MAFQRPTLAEIVERVTQDFLSRLSLTGAVLRRSMVYVVSRVVGGASHMMHGYIAWASRQILPTTQEKEFLTDFGANFGVTRLAATFAAGTVAVTGDSGAIVIEGTVFQRADEVQYRSTADATLVSGTADIPVEALVAGIGGNADEGVALTFVSPITGVDGVALVSTGGLTTGADAESDDDLRARILTRMREPPLGGSVDDYKRWAKEVSGVTRVWVTPLASGPGTVGVLFVCDNDEDIIPDSGKVAEVQAWIDRPDKRPVTAVVTVAAPTEVALDPEISLTPNTAATQAAATAQLNDMLARLAEPGATIPLSQIEGALFLAEGVTDFVITSPAADVTHDTDEIATLGDPTWS